MAKDQLARLTQGDLWQSIERLGLVRDLPQALAFTLGLYLVLGILELGFPAERGHTTSGRARNLILTAIGAVLGGISISIVYPRVAPRVVLLSDLGLTSSLAAAFFSALAVDFVYYWYHRLQHTIQPLWALHELHHSDGELNATTSMRTYWLERPIQAFVIGIPVGLLAGVDQRAALLLSLLLPSWLFFAHANLRLRLGILTPLICGPQLHRIHHSSLPEHRNKNFAQYFPFIDVVFGTYYAPARGEFPPTGAPELRSDAAIATVMVRPFRLWAAWLRGLVNIAPVPGK